MFHIVRLGLIFLFGGAAAAAIEDSPAGAFVMGAISLALTIWMIVDISKAINGVAS
jgi:hypothetical protein